MHKSVCVSEILLRAYNYGGQRHWYTLGAAVGEVIAGREAEEDMDEEGEAGEEEEEEEE